VNDSKWWNAVITNDRSYDGKFFYGVKSTGIFCRPSCASKPPKPENVVSFESKEEAEKAGFRPCKRCRPDLIAYDPVTKLVDEAKAIIDCSFAERLELKEKLNALGITQRHLTELFEKRFDISPQQYIAQIRFRRAKELLDAGERITDTAYAVGMESASSFATFFKKQGGMSPKEYASQQALQQPYCFFQTPLGLIRIEENQYGITSLRFVDKKTEHAPVNGNGVYLSDAELQISEYFAKKRKLFDVPLSMMGSEFQKSVWSALRDIPYGETRSYKRIAETIGNKGAARAVGMANNRNPILIMVPCHRVVGQDGKLVGYAGGIDRKQYLLEMEAIQ
jgi:AraC family transcriptional regulator of adaptative response/methylated-DNA-[protein]-cysteine methyltransferase